MVTSVVIYRVFAGPGPIIEAAATVSARIAELTQTNVVRPRIVVALVQLRGGTRVTARTTGRT